MNYILDTLYEFWQYIKPKGSVYLAGRKYKDYYILVRMIPENIALPDGYEKLTDAMPKQNAERRIQHFKMIRLIQC